MFEKGTTIPLDNVPIVMKPGLEKNVQSVGDDLKNAMTILQIDGFVFYQIFSLNNC